MSKSDAFENALLLLLCNNTNIANIGDATGLRGSTTVGSLYIAFHTSDPGEAGNQSTNETAYTGYARQAVARSSAALLVTANSVSPVNNVDFPACSASPGSNITHVSIGTSSSGGGMILWSGSLASAIVMNVGTIPRWSNASTITED